MNDNLILEDVFYTLDDSDGFVIEEDIEGGERQYYFKGNFGRANFKNKNGRWYPSDVMAEAFAEVKKNMKNGEYLLAELGHPDNPQMAKRINYENVCCKFTDLTFNESTGYLSGVAKPTSFGKGDIAKGLIKDGIKVGFSTRCAGKVQPGKTVLGENALIVQPGLRFLACDLVSNPSAGTFPTAIIESEESTSKIWTGWSKNTIKSIIERVF